MAYKKILVATDGSDHSQHAAQQAAELAGELGSEVEVLSVAVIHPMYGGLHIGAIGAEGLEQEAEKAAELAALDTAKVFKDKGIPCKTVVTVAMGSPGNVICKEADESGADLIVMGCRGLGPTGSLILGSVSQHVVHCSTKPVLVVR